MNVTTSGRTEPEDIFCQTFKRVRIFVRVPGGGGGGGERWLLYGMSAGWC